MVPLIITMDLELAYDHRLTEQYTIINRLCTDFQSMNLPMTVFTTSEFAEKYPDKIRLLSTFNNEIGSHGVNHSICENYKNMSKEKADNYIETASNILSNILKESPACFRGPGMTTSSSTQNLLIKYGYKADFSVCSQRFDFFNSKGGDIRWLFAPRVPYQPSEYSPYKKGKLPIRIIPLSAIGLPFMSGIMYLFGFNFMTFLFRLLLKESLRTHKPIVYLFHSYEFTDYTNSSSEFTGMNKTDRYNRPLLHKLYKSDIYKRYDMNISLLKYMLSYKSVHPFKGKEYCEFLCNQTL